MWSLNLKAMEATAEAARLRMEAALERRDAARERLEATWTRLPERLVQVQTKIKADLNEALRLEAKSRETLEAARRK